MPRTGVFTLAGPNEGKTMVILDKYPFKDGVFKTPAAYAPLMAMILCNYYSCVLTYEGDEAEATEEGEDVLNADGSLAVSVTRGLTEGQKMENQDMHAKLQVVEKYESDEMKLVEKRAEERAILDAQLAAKPASTPAPAPADLETDPDGEDE